MRQEHKNILAKLSKEREASTTYQKKRDKSASILNA
jgi:hypothetical protein